MIRVLVADDHAMFRDMLKIAVPRTGEAEVVGEASDGRELLAVAERLQPDVLLLDYKMPHVRNFAALIRELRAKQAGLGVVVLSGFASVEIATAAANGGARGYVLKSTRLEAVTDAIRTVHGGGTWIDPSLPTRAFEIFQQAAEIDGGARKKGLGDLTRREREVLACVAVGHRNRDIARKLFVSEPTVKVHLTRIFAKLDVTNRLAAALAFYGKETGAGLAPEPAREPSAGLSSGSR